MCVLHLHPVELLSEWYLSALQVTAKTPSFVLEASLISSLTFTPSRRHFFFFLQHFLFFSEKMMLFPAKISALVNPRTLVSSCASIHPGWVIQRSHVGEVSGNRRSRHFCSSAGLVTPVNCKHCSSFNSACETRPTRRFHRVDRMLALPRNAAALWAPDPSHPWNQIIYGACLMTCLCAAANPVGGGVSLSLFRGHMGATYTQRCSVLAADSWDLIVWLISVSPPWWVQTSTFCLHLIQPRFPGVCNGKSTNFTLVRCVFLPLTPEICHADGTQQHSSSWMLRLVAEANHRNQKRGNRLRPSPGQTRVQNFMKKDGIKARASR